MGNIPNKPFKDFTTEEFMELEDYLTHEMWDKGSFSIPCPICGGTVTMKIMGSSSVTKCSTPDCICYTERGL